MKTFIFIIAVLFLIFLINTSIRSGESENLKSINKKTNLVGNFGLVFLAVGILFINFSGFFPSDSEIAELKEKQETEKIEAELKRKEDSIAKIPKKDLVIEAYKTINNFNDENEAYLQINKERLISLRDKVINTKYEVVVQKSIDSIDNLKNKIEEKNSIIERKNYETILRNNFLDNNLNIKVKVSGKNNTKITLTYPLFNEVWHRKFETEGHFDKLNQKGFKIIIMEDGYDYAQGIKYD